MEKPQTVSREPFPRVFDGKPGSTLSIELVCLNVGAAQRAGESKSGAASAQGVLQPECSAEPMTGVESLPELDPSDVVASIKTAASHAVEHIVDSTGFTSFAKPIEVTCEDGKRANDLGRLLSCYNLLLGQAQFRLVLTRKIDEDRHNPLGAEQREEERLIDSQRDASRTPRGGGSSKFRDVEAFSEKFQDDPDFDEIEFCTHCHDALDRETERFRRGLKCTQKYVFDESMDAYGVECECHQYLFCSTACLDSHTAGDQPAVEPVGVREYKKDRNLATQDQLYLLQARERRKIAEEHSAEWLEEELKKRKKSAGLSYLAPEEDGKKPGEQYESKSALGRTVDSDLAKLHGTRPANSSGAGTFSSGTHRIM